MQPEIVTLAGPDRLRFYDCARAELPVALGALEVWNLIMTGPQPLMQLAFRIRDAVSARFGVRRIGGFSGTSHDRVGTGDRLDFFLVEHAGPHLLVLTERDRHLDVMTCISTAGNMVAITSSVITHNLYGRIYMLPVGIAHRFIVRNMLRRLRHRLMRR
ncbi:DUF2867 domain-containing protein [Rhodobacter sp. 24-YEA-8]|uniref:DUF2867 domain-containing protein n=1 Tax=Rhodobacter sp. 24-YEA-8 TaxID=1884310 RepID=UPI000898CA29|nr:DUF2867 domain-containing protein [Rhodobacter sp. 24-YEA-8]SEB64293.1 Protein of unknown function [Rhodobacter sp. 24-YEA-8]